MLLALTRPVASRIPTITVISSYWSEVSLTCGCLKDQAVVHCFSHTNWQYTWDNQCLTTRMPERSINAYHLPHVLSFLDRGRLLHLESHAQAVGCDCHTQQMHASPDQKLLMCLSHYGCDISLARTCSLMLKLYLCNVCEALRQASCQAYIPSPICHEPQPSGGCALVGTTIAVLAHHDTQRADTLQPWKCCVVPWGLYSLLWQCDGKSRKRKLELLSRLTRGSRIGGHCCLRSWHMRSLAHANMQLPGTAITDA